MKLNESILQKVFILYCDGLIKKCFRTKMISINDTLLHCRIFVENQNQPGVEQESTLRGIADVAIISNSNFDVAIEETIN